MSYFGDIRLGDTIDVKFTTTAASTGAPTTLSGTPVISAYPSNSTTEITAGITLTVDFDARTGLNNVRIVASGGNGFATATNYALVITTGTVGGTSAVGYVIGTFSIENRSALMPTTAARTLDVATTGEAGLDYTNVLLPSTGAIPALGIIESGTMQSGSTASTAVLRSATNFVSDNIPNGATILILSGTGAGQSRLISSYVNSTDTATVSVNWTTTPDNTSVYVIYGTGLSGAGSLTAADVWTYVSRTLTAATNITSTGGTIPITSSRVDASVGAYQAGLTPLQPTVAGRTLDVTATGEAGVDWANIGSPTTAVNLSGTTISTSQAVASVSGNVGGNVSGSVASVVGFTPSDVTSIKAKTDQLTFTVANTLNCRITYVVNTALQTSGTGGQGYGG